LIEHGPEVGCIGKVQFDTRERANTAAKRRALKKRPMRNPYRCKECGKWHLGQELFRSQHRQNTRKRKEALHDV
jgi:hypothetical protein